MAEEETLLHYLKLVTADLHATQERLREVEEAEHEPVAIIGMACRLPGGVGAPEDLWRLVAEGADAITGFPDDRGWDLDLLSGISSVREGGFLPGADRFDAGFFGISPREALAMDPQQRLLLETGWEAVERAGIDPTSLRGTRTGVFVGSNNQDHVIVLANAGEDVAGYGVTGATASVLSGRVAYSLGLSGPALTVDTACSSSLVSIHLAALSLRRGECSLALAGGVALMATPAMFVEAGQQGALASDGRCRAFAEGADGTGWGEGVGWLLLEKLSDARRNGHEVLALITGSAVNQDGASNGLTAPNGPAQQRVVLAALDDAGLTPDQVDAVEGHGTGTALGDPIEIQALQATYGRGRAADRPLWLGSLKSNIGHTQAAAGVAGVIKLVLAMRHGLLPRTLHADRPTTAVDWSAGAVRVLREPTPWPVTGAPRRAAVSSFGVSGTNAHLVLEQAPEVREPGDGSDGDAEHQQADVPGHDPGAAPVGLLPWVVSGRTEGALREQARRLLAFVEANPGATALDVAHSLITTRTAFRHRAVVLGGDRGELVAGLAALAAGESSAAVVEGVAEHGDKAVFVFPGYGSQWPGMAVELLDAEPVFREEFLACERAFTQWVDWSPTDVLRQAPGAPDLDGVDVTQVVLFAVTLSLAALWRSYGVEPSAVIGHSQGEIVAACVAGAVSREDAAHVVAVRAALQESLGGAGAMVSVRSGVAELLPRIARYGDRISVAAVNGPAAVVLSGEREALDRVRAELAADGIGVRDLPTDVAGHSAHIDQIRDDLLDVLTTLSARPSPVPFFSTVTGTRLDTADLDVDHWYRNVRDTVRFADGARAVLDHGYRLLLEISPHPVLAMGLQDIAEHSGVPAVVCPTLRRGEGGRDRFVRALAHAYAHGVRVDFSPLFAGAAPRTTTLPTYAFQHDRYRLQPAPRATDASSLGLAPGRHPLVDAETALPGADGVLLTSRLSRRTHPWLAEHAVFGAALVPGTAYLELAFRAGDLVGAGSVDELTVQAPLLLPEHGGVSVQVFVGGPHDGRRSIAIYSRPDDQADDRTDGGRAGEPWTCHATGRLGAGSDRPEADLRQWPPTRARSVDLDGLYERLADEGFGYGPLFQGLRAVWRRGDEVFAEVELPEPGHADVGGFGLHPALLDAAFHALLAVSADEDRPPAMLFSWSDARLLAAGATRLRVRLALRADGSLSLLAADQGGDPVVTAGTVLVREVDPTAHRRAAAPRRSLLRPDREPLALGHAEPVAAPVVRERAELSEFLVDGEPPVLVLQVGPAGTAEAATAEVTAFVDDWLAGARTGRLVVLTTDATAPAPDPAHAAVGGLMRSVQARHPDRVLLVDTDGAAESFDALPDVLGAAFAAGEPVVSVHGGAASVPRLVRVPAGLDTAGLDTAGPDAAGLDTAGPAAAGPSTTAPWAGTVLVCGPPTPVTAPLVAHLLDRGARRVVLAGPGAAAVDLPGEVVAVDWDPATADAPALDDLLADLPADAPLTAVLHVPGDDTAPGAPAALDAATRDRDLSAFVLFSSTAGLLGAPGDGVADAVAEAVVRGRRAAGSPALVLAWDPDGPPVGDELVLLDAAVLGAEPVLVAMRPVPRGDVPPLLRNLVTAPNRRTVDVAASGAATGLARRLAGLPAAERTRALVDLVRTEAAVVLGYADAAAVPPRQPFRELGFASITAVELRNRLRAATGLPLPATLVFDYPSAGALGERLRALLDGADLPAAREPAAPGAADEPIAIVGMACRLPGDVHSPEDLWRLVADEVDAVTDLPADRGWDVAALYDPERGRPDTSYVRTGGFVRGAGLFDAGFFGINPREALAMDPQQRLLLETAWEAFERAGLDPAAVRGADAGVFVGSNGQDHALVLAASSDDLAGYRATGVGASVMSGRVAYAFGLEGPAMTVDTACSSSLVALHLAAESLRRGECSMALAGGCSILSTPTQFVEFSKQGALSADGRSKAYSAAADGFAVAEGVGWVLLERLSDAVRHGRRVLAVVRGSAVNQDGASNGLTAPNGPSQQRVIRAALAGAGLSSADVDVVEGHGTGTALGDPIEAQALLATYGQERETPLWLGSIKSNIGHAQAAAGVAGVIKMVMALRQGVLPRTLHVDEPTPQVDWSSGAVEVLRESRSWPETGRPRRAAVSSFGISGTNAHVILEQAEGATDTGPTPSEPIAVPWVLSARTEQALRAQAARLLEFVGNDPDLSTVDIGYSLVATRSVLDHRAVVVGRDRDELVRGLTALAGGSAAANVVSGRAGSDDRVVFVFPGQGSQWVGMAAGLLDTEPVFAEEFAACSAALREWVDWSPEEVLRGVEGAPGMDRVDVVQPVLFAVMVSLAALWRSYGVEPSAVIGHSQGEIAAACAIGALSRADAAKVVALRSRALVRIAGLGGMMSVRLGHDELLPQLEPWGDRISVAAVNGPQAVVVSGEPDALDELQRHLTDQDVTARRIPVDYAAHSAQVDLIRDELLTVLADVVSTAVDTPFFSCVAGDRRGTDDLDADYWHRNLRDTVLFDRAALAALTAGHRLVLEASPHPVLVMSVQDVADAAGVDAATWGTLRRDDGGADRVLLSLAEAHVHGAAVDWTPVFAGARVADLPTYAFQHERYWPAPAAASADAASMGLVGAGHPMLGAEIPLPDSGELVLTGRISLPTHPWLADHVVSDMTIVPGTAFVELAFRAAAQVGCDRVEELTVQAPLLLDERGAFAVQVVIAAPLDDGQRRVTVYARPVPTGDELEDEDWTCHATGWLAPAAGEPDVGALAVWPPVDARAVTAEEVYRQLVAAGYGYGPIFQGLRAVWVRGREVFAEVSLPAEASGDAGAFGLHPALFDAAFHALIAGQPRTDDQPLRLPFAWTGVRLFAEGSRAMRVRMDLTSEETVSVTAVDELGRPVVAVDSLLVREIAAAPTAAAAGGHHRGLFRLGWEPLAVTAPEPATERWAVVADRPVPGLGSARWFPSWSDLADDGEPVDVVVLPVAATGDGDVPGAVREVLARVLGDVQRWLADERFATGRLVVLTRRAVTAPGDGAPDAAQASVWGLLRSAQSENPDRVVLVDLDGEPTADLPRLDGEPAADLPRVVAAATAAGEPQVAVRGAAASVARLARVPAAPAEPARSPDPDGTVVVTGASGMLAGHVARHLAAGGARRLLLVSRRGHDAPTTPRLVADLADLGAEATVAACDVADREALAAVLAAVPAEHPVTAVVHTAGLLDDGVLGSLTPERVDAVLRPKVDAVWHLHELTLDLDLAAFAVFSSAAGTLGGGGQGAYAAANAWLDAFAAHRHALGLPAVSLAWGMWADSADPDAPGMAGHLGAADRGRVNRGGLRPMGFEQGMAVFDTCLGLDLPAVLPMRLDVAALRAPDGAVPALLRGLVRTPARRRADAAPPPASGLVDRLTAMSPAERGRFLVEVVREQAAAVLGHASARQVPTDEAFRDLGFDSLTAVELRNRLKVATGLTLPATLVFDHPTPRALADFLLAELAPGGGGARALPAQAEFDRLEAALAAIPQQEATGGQVAERLRALLDRWTRGRRAAELTAAPAAGAGGRTDLGAASTDEIFAFIDNELGRSRA
ncbi:type I polyketide synthase [Saccharothrix xinjiangensis]